MIDDIALSNNQESQITCILGSESQISGMDTSIRDLKAEIEAIDFKSRELLLTPRKSQNELSGIKAMFAQLSTHQLALRSKAIASREFVEEITSEIQKLDTIKKNLNQSIAVLKKIHVVVQSLDYLQGLLTRKQFQKIAEILVVVDAITITLAPMKSVQQIKALLDRYNNYQIEAQKIILLEFQQSFNSNIIKHQSELLYDACLVLDVLPIEAKNQLVKWYIDLQLQDYKNLFILNLEVAGLKDISRRYSWLKRSLKNYDDQHSILFPLHWTMDSLICLQFCEETRKNLTDVVIASERDLSFDTTVLLQAINATTEFEAKLLQRFSNPSNLSSINNLYNSNRFTRIISCCFDPFLWHYVEIEDSTMAVKLDSFKKSIGKVDEGTLLFEKLEQKLVETIEKEYKSMISFTMEVEAFTITTATMLLHAAKYLESALEAPILALAKKNWSNIVQVGDQSDHITAIATILSQIMPTIKLSPKYYKSLCDKFVEYLLLKCKPMSEVGGEQMLLDIHSLAPLLQNLSHHPTLTKILNRGISLIDKLLKVVMRQFEPPEGIVDTFMLLYTDDATSANLVKILEIKGLRRSDVNIVLDCFAKRGGVIGTAEANRYQGFVGFMKHKP